MKLLVKVLIAVGICALLLFGLWYWGISSLFHSWGDTPYKYEEIYTSGVYSITVWRSDAVWSFGSANVKITAFSGEEAEEYETQISDDGGKGSVEVRWLDNDTAQVTLQGDEQRDEIVIVDFFGGIQITTDRWSAAKEGA